MHARRSVEGQAIEREGRGFCLAPRLCLLAGLGFTSLAALWSLQAATLTRLSELAQWSPLEYAISGVPAAANPFDPEVVSLDAAVTLPSGRQATVPAFWYQAYSRSLQDGAEALASQGAPGWRLRFTPSEVGDYLLSLSVTTNGQSAGPPATTRFNVPASSGQAARPGFVRVAANNRYFETDQGQPLPLLGACVCWHGRRGTRDYDDWFEAMQRAGENYARLWMAPWAFGIEAEPGTGLHYRQDRAWQLDYVFRLAEQKGVYLLLCLDYHGMFEVDPDYWGGGNLWPKNPYNAANGGPCATQDEFFSREAARRMYQKRLRYLIARFGYSQNLLAWQFFNELDNAYDHLNWTNVVAWHAAMGDWLRAHDPYRHLVTTSLTGGSDRPDIWRLPQMDFAVYHSYNQPQPAAALPGIAQSFFSRYQKPVMIGEFGTDWRGWRREQDPWLRGWRQGLWAGALAGSVGTSMSWYWESIHGEDLYPYYVAMGGFLGRAGWGHGRWEPLLFQSSGEPPAAVGSLLPGGQPFAATLKLNEQWGPKLRGQVAVTDPLGATFAPAYLNSFVHGTAHAELRIPFKLEAWFATNAQLVLHLNSVSTAPVLTVRQDGVEVFRRPLLNKDGAWLVNNEYNEDITVALAPGKHLIEIRNAGVDWFYLDWVRLENVQPADYANGWQPSPIACGLWGERGGLVYAVSPHVNYPANATNQVVQPFRSASLVIKGVPAGPYQAFWHEPTTGRKVGETTGVSDGTQVVLPLPEFSEDLAGRLIEARPFSLQSPRWQEGQFNCELAGDVGRVYLVERSPDLRAWQPWVWLTNETGATHLSDPVSGAAAQRFYRGRLAD